MNNEPRLERTRRNLPHWVLNGSCYFITSRIRSGVLSPEERMLVLERFLEGDDRYYRLAGVVIMPDHVHALLRPLDWYSLSRIL